jgi:hypothetical protein
MDAAIISSENIETIDDSSFILQHHYTHFFQEMFRENRVPIIFMITIGTIDSHRSSQISKWQMEGS